MVSQKKAANQRDDVRCAVVGGCHEAILRFKGRNIPAALVDESAGGFAVRIGDARPVEVGDTLVLRTAMGCFKVRVARVTQESSPDGISAGGDQTGGSSRILGLQRLEDLVEDVLHEARSRSSLSQSLGGILDSSTMLVAVAIVILCIGGLWAATVLSGGSDEEPQGWTTSSAGRRVALGNASNSSQRWTGRSTQKKDAVKTPTLPWRKERSEMDVVSRSSPSLRSQFRQRSRQLPQMPAAATLLSSKMIDELALTDKQQKAIRRILQSAERLRDDSRSRAQGSPDQLDESLKAQFAEIDRLALDLLNESQRARWSELRPSG